MGACEPVADATELVDEGLRLTKVDDTVDGSAVNALWTRVSLSMLRGGRKDGGLTYPRHRSRSCYPLDPNCPESNRTHRRSPELGKGQCS